MKPPMGPPNQGGRDNPFFPDDKGKDKEKNVTGIVVTRSDQYVLFKVKLVLTSKEKDLLKNAAGLVVTGLKGEMDLAATTNHVDQLQKLSAGVVRLAATNKGFPQAALPRAPARERSGYRWEPEKRVSWMAALLPHLGHDKLYRSIKWDPQNPGQSIYSWDDPENLMVARTLVPEFLDPSYPHSSHYVSYPGIRTDVAATHFVAIAGIGEETADEMEGDAETAKRLGVFGYNRTTPLAAMERGASQTAVIIQVPPTYGAPWMAGGGSTVRGIPEKRSIEPFVSVTLPSGEKGTYVLMADGSVRFVSDKISPEAFKAMCTTRGKADMSNDWKPVIKGAEMKADQQPPEAAPKK
jgi:hypothetical protein